MKYSAVELDQYADAQAVKDHLAHMTGAGTTPRVFVAQKFVGGEDALVQAQKAGTMDLVLNAPDFASAQ